LSIKALEITPQNPLLMHYSVIQNKIAPSKEKHSRQFTPDLTWEPDEPTVTTALFGITKDVR
jgi:hypothetical protein